MWYHCCTSRLYKDPGEIPVKISRIRHLLLLWRIHVVDVETSTESCVYEDSLHNEEQDDGGVEWILHSLNNFEFFYSADVTSLAMVNWWLKKLIVSQKRKSLLYPQTTSISEATHHDQAGTRTKGGRRRKGAGENKCETTSQKQYNHCSFRSIHLLKYYLIFFLQHELRVLSRWSRFFRSSMTLSCQPAPQDSQLMLYDDHFQILYCTVLYC